MKFNPFKIFLKRYHTERNWDNKKYSDFSKFEKDIYHRVSPYTMTGPERIKALINSIEYIIKNDIKGDFVECGVWKGGSIMTIAQILLKYGISDRKIWLYDTFEGMTEPEDIDRDMKGRSAKERLINEDKFTSRVWGYSTIEEVKHNVSLTGYPLNNIIFVKGKVEETLLKNNLPEVISFLRLDTDWFKSTKIQLEVLYPLVTRNGFILIDDYGHWEGCQKAVDDFLDRLTFPPFLNRIDYTGRLLIKIDRN
jgi:hypothetical protein